MTMVLNWVNWAPVTLFHNWTSPDLVTLVPLWVLLCPSDCEPDFGLTCTCFPWLPPAPDLEMLTLVLSRASPVPGDPGPHLGLTWTW